MLSVRIDGEKKAKLEARAERLGYESTSEFVLDVLDAIIGPDTGDGYECRMVHVSEGRIVGTGPKNDIEPTPSFPVTAPDEFWRAVEASR